MAGFEDREVARKAGQTSRRGKGLKSQHWELLGESILSGHASKVNKELSKLTGARYIEAYVSLLKYFKPVLRSVQLEVEVPPQELYEPDRRLDKMSNEQLITEIKLLDND